MPEKGRFDDAPSFPLSEIKKVLGEQIATLIEYVAVRAQGANRPLFLAGGVVRDLLLGRRTLDLDFVVEGDAIGFARSLAKEFGGSVQAHKPFGTAKWTLDVTVTQKLSLAHDQIPPHLDFATARSETYAHPTALPSVSPSDIERDLLRRDFSINALAIQLSPVEKAGDLLEACGGRDDLKRGLIRALHPNSFADDPTRILRAARYGLRLDFEVEAQTAMWMLAALPLLGRVSGQRVRNEIDLILCERCAGEMMLRLQELGALAQIHPAFCVSSRLPSLIARCNERTPPWTTEHIDRQTLRWIMLFADIGADEAKSLCEHLALTKALTSSITASTRLAEHISLLEDAALRPSQITKLLDEYMEPALEAAWLWSADGSVAQARIATYASDWRQQRSSITGHELKAMGLIPGPRYRRILERLRFAWIDGEVGTVEAEQLLLQRLLDGET